MPSFTVPVRLYMSAPVQTIASEELLPVAGRRLQELNISSLPIVDSSGSPVGIISRTDLLRAGRREAGSDGSASLLTLPDRAVLEVATTELLSVEPDTPVDQAARQMCRQRVHRVIVMEDGRLVGVLSTRDLMTLVRDKRMNNPLSEFMSAPLYTVRASEPISLATERLEKAKVSGLVVLEEDGWPVGVFRQVEALESRDMPRSTAIDEAMNPAILILGATTRMHRAAAQAIAMGARRVIVTKAERPVGILSGLDFARAVSS